MLGVVGQQCWVRFHGTRVRNIAEPIVYLFIYLLSILWVRRYPYAEIGGGGAVIHTLR